MQLAKIIDELKQIEIDDEEIDKAKILINSILTKKKIMNNINLIKRKHENIDLSFLEDFDKVVREKPTYDTSYDYDVEFTLFIIDELEVNRDTKVTIYITAEQITDIQYETDGHWRYKYSEDNKGYGYYLGKLKLDEIIHYDEDKKNRIKREIDKVRSWDLLEKIK